MQVSKAYHEANYFLDLFFEKNLFSGMLGGEGGM